MANRRKALEGDVVPHRDRPDPPEPDEDPSPEDIERFGHVTVTCPECKTELLDDADICWNCGRALLANDTSPAIPLWAIIATVVLVTALVIAIM